MASPPGSTRRRSPVSSRAASLGAPRWRNPAFRLTAPAMRTACMGVMGLGPVARIDRESDPFGPPTATGEIKLNQPSCASVPSTGDSSAAPGHAPGTTACIVDGKLAEIVGHIDRHICDPDLGATSLQAAFRLSRPTLYRMFQPLGGVCQHIRRRRVLVAHQHLRQDPDCSITWLLYEAGFTSERQFQRAFRAVFGL